MVQFSLCVSRPFVAECSNLGLSVGCVYAWDEFAPDALRLWWAQMLTGIFLTMIGIYNFAVARGCMSGFCVTRRGVQVVSSQPGNSCSESESEDSDESEKDARLSADKNRIVQVLETTTPWARLNLATYCIATASFAFARAEWHNSKPLLVGAAFHNLFEWGFIVMMYQKKVRDQQMYFVAALALIASVMLGVILLEEFVAYSLLEQVTGLVLDFLIPYLHWSLWQQSGNELWRYAFLASFIHLIFTILPIVWMNYHVFQFHVLERLAEFSVMISTCVTMMLYTRFVSEYDQVRVDTRDESADTKDEHLSRVGFIKCFLIALILANAALVGYPLALGFCESGREGLANVDNRAIVGTAVGTVYPGMSRAFEDKIYNSHLIESARKWNGNLGYELMKNARNGSEYRFVEKWANLESLQSWLDGPIVTSVFKHDAEMRGMLVGGSLRVVGGYHVLEPQIREPSVRHGSVRFQVDNECSALWNVINDFGNCRWVIGCESSSKSTTSQGMEVQTLHMEDGSVVKFLKRFSDEYKMVLQYEVVLGETREGTGAYRAEIRLVRDEESGREKCNAVFSAALSPEFPVSVRAWYNDMARRVPVLKQRFAEIRG